MNVQNSSRFTMTIDMAVLKSLGINLYSNAAAVLAELVANAYDADATLVQIEWRRKQSTVIVSDDGCGMTPEELNDRFLVTGYPKREIEGTHSVIWDRPFMGRKGIGKLSVFSIADEVTIYTTKDGLSTGCKIVADDLNKSIRRGELYRPDEVGVPEEYSKQGTTLVLEKLKSKRVDLTAAALRKRLARRFDVLDQKPRQEGGFKIEVDGERLTFEDRQDLKELEYVWEFGEERLSANTLPKVVKRFILPQCNVDGRDDWTVRGWIGTARTPSDLTKDDEAGSLKNVMIQARKRPIHEGILDKLDFTRVFGNYVTGQVEADFLDASDSEDIATSDRQRLIEDDERVQALQRFLREAFKRASDQWNAERPKQKAVEAFEEFPQLKRWHDALDEWQQVSARKIIGTITALPMEAKLERAQRASLYRHGVLAFARVGLRKNAEDLDQLASVEAEELLKLLGAQGEYEASLWVDILRSRVEAIQQLKKLADNNELERALQEHLFDNLYLLDPAWEHATGDKHMEEDIRTIDPDVLAVDDQGNSLRWRFDIRYRTVARSHVIVELKRSNRTLSIDELSEQGQKYYAALRSILKQQNRTSQRIEVVFVLGSAPRVPSSHALQGSVEYTELEFKKFNGRYVLYNELIRNAHEQYGAYLAAATQANQLEELLASLEE